MFDFVKILILTIVCFLFKRNLGLILKEHLEFFLFKISVYNCKKFPEFHTQFLKRKKYSLKHFFHWKNPLHFPWKCLEKEIIL